jgi:UDP-N-acetylglucosamine 2-epimerase (non-hydrolysing)
MVSPAKLLKVMTIVGTRPELIKLSRIMAELGKYTKHILVHTGQNYDHELNGIFFNELEIKKPNYFLEAATENLAQDIGNIISRIDPILEKEKPDAILFYGDTNSSLSVIPAKRRQIPIFHMEAGNRCFDARVSEEINRKIIDHLSDINMPLSEHARNYLIREGIKPETIIKTGSPMKELYEYHHAKIKESNVLSQMNLSERDYFVVSLHREDNVDPQENLVALLKALNIVAKTYDKRIIVSTHPRTKKRLDQLQTGDKSLKCDPKIEFLKPFGFFDYVKLQMNAFCVLSDSGSITEESSILNFPAITLRRMHERPEGMDVGTLIMTGFDVDRILQSIEVVTKQWENGEVQFSIVPDYNVNNVSKKVVRIILSYVDYINRTVWGGL